MGGGGWELTDEEGDRCTVNRETARRTYVRISADVRVKYGNAITTTDATMYVYIFNTILRTIPYRNIRPVYEKHGGN